MTGHTTLNQIRGAGTTRMLLLGLLALAGLTLLGFVTASVVRFSMPAPAFTEIGLLEDFPPSDQPYEIYVDEGRFFLVNNGGALIAHYPVYPRRPSCPIRWWSEERTFIDPCLGTQFWLDGSYRTGPPATMQRYPLAVEDGKIRVDLTHTLPGPELVEADGDY